MHVASLTPASIRSQVERILATDAFRKSAILSRFLGHIVEETLKGNAVQLKEYSIALEVLSRKPDFNPQNDAIVRIHAGRLRRALHAYYQADGRAEPVFIDIPKGSYVPEFHDRPEQAMQDKAMAGKMDPEHKVTVAVLPFGNRSVDPGVDTLADGLGDSISNELTRYPDLGVISYFSCRSMFANSPDIMQAGRSLGAEFIVTGSVQSVKHQLRISVQLSLARTREQIWAETYERIHDDEEYFGIQQDIAWKVVSQTAGHFGAISRSLSRKKAAHVSGNIGNYNTLYWYYDFVANHSESLFHKVEKTFTEVLRKDPDYAMGWALLGEVQVAGHFYGYRSQLHHAALDRAVEFGQKSVKIDPLCQQGYQTIALARIFRQEWNDSMKTILEWEKILPHASGVQCAMGFIAICCGEYEKGHALASEAMRLNPYYQWWVNAGMCYYHFHIEEYEEALAWAEKMNQPEVPWWYISRVCCLHEMGRGADAESLILQMFERFPPLKDILEPYVRAFIKDSCLTDRFLSIIKSIQAEVVRKEA